MKKKLMMTALTSVFALGVLSACGDVENDPMYDNNGFENNGINDDMSNDTDI
ncbi:hypothetical protein MM221_06690 [Salipaludibacillus sp. LMS25]|jgi:hypothetical protein|uniref:hypothetical protein n=1 Tax=Salipaludibacillus sp. LMS25 TaxID=2924031 RepID=UPI0020D0E82E|nr:hypothetical protein [Salipaludibacillus sp. LMS25]UTR16237.1 hypothetical protein MM221_06690 [Salipaludibacillus sp. LMS25]